MPLRGILNREYAHVQRYRQIMDVLIKHGFGYLVDRYGLHPRSWKERIFGPREIPKKLLAMSGAARFRRALEELGPTFVKFGQILSTRYDMVPQDYIDELSKLQDMVPPFEFWEVRRVIQGEFGKGIEELFKSFGREPVAAASIGQVHLARLKGGEEVIVKVRRPNIERTIEVDLDILSSLAHFAERHIRETRIFSPVGMVEEFARVIRNELNYVQEAQNAERFYRNFNGYPGVRIPRVFWELTTNKVLTLEYLEGIKISDLEAIDAAGLDRRTLAKSLSNAYLKQIYLDGFFHGDPHPGNIFVTKDGALAFLDFGMAGYIDRITRENLTNLMIAIRNYDLDELIGAISDLGFIRNIGTVYPALRVELEDLINRYYAISTKYISPATFLRDLISLIARHRGRIPSNIMLLSKTLLILDEVNSKLDPEHSFAEHTEPFVNQLIRERTRPTRIIRELADVLWDSYHILRKAPQRIDHILSKAETGTLKLEFEHHGLDRLADETSLLSNRLSISLIISALIVGSSLIIQTGMRPHILGVPALGVLGFLFAAVLGIGLLISILRSGIF